MDKVLRQSIEEYREDILSILNDEEMRDYEKLIAIREYIESV